MSSRSTRIRLPLAVLAGALAAAPAVAQETIGDEVQQRTLIDSFANFILVSSYTFSPGALGQPVTSVSVFGGNSLLGGSNVGRTFVPLLVTAPAGGSFTVTGVGTARVVAPGVQTFAFGLTDGSALVGASTRMAWLSVGPGAVHFDFGSEGSGGLVSYTMDATTVSASAGQSFEVLDSQVRVYSIQFTAGEPPVGSTVPEPATVALVGGGLLALVAVGRRGRRSAQSTK
jgi:hypothetical protein